MIDPNFDPYDELMIARHNINELIKAMNTQSELLKEMSAHHNTLAALHRSLHRQVQNLEIEVSRLKLRQI